MSEDVDRLIETENEYILDLLHNDDAVYVVAYFSLDKDGKRVYDMDMIREEFESNIETLIELNRQKGLTK